MIRDWANIKFLNDIFRFRAVRQTLFISTLYKLPAHIRTGLQWHPKLSFPCEYSEKNQPVSSCFCWKSVSCNSLQTTFFFQDIRILGPICLMHWFILS